MRGEGVNEPDDIEVLPCNWWGVQAYLRCQQTVLSGMAGAILMGVSAQEVRAAAQMLRIPSRDWPQTIDVAQELAALVARVENDKAAAKARAKR